MLWWPDIMSPSSWLYNLYHSRRNIQFNFSYLDNPNLDRMIQQVRQLELVDQSKAVGLVHQIQEWLHREAVSLTAYELKSSWAYHRNIKGFRYNPAYQEVIFFYDLQLNTPR